MPIFYTQMTFKKISIYSLKLWHKKRSLLDSEFHLLDFYLCKILQKSVNNVDWRWWWWQGMLIFVNDNVSLTNLSTIQTCKHLLPLHKQYNGNVETINNLFWVIYLMCDGSRIGTKVHLTIDYICSTAS